jgi:hypothetical protein
MIRKPLRYRHQRLHQNLPKEIAKVVEVGRNGERILRINNLYWQSCVEWREYYVTAMTV